MARFDEKGCGGEEGLRKLSIRDILHIFQSADRNEICNVFQNVKEQRTPKLKKTKRQREIQRAEENSTHLQPCHLLLRAAVKALSTEVCPFPFLRFSNPNLVSPFQLEICS